MRGGHVTGAHFAVPARTALQTRGKSYSHPYFLTAVFLLLFSALEISSSLVAHRPRT